MNSIITLSKWLHVDPRGADDIMVKLIVNTGRKIAPNTGANAPKLFTLATKSLKLVAKLATRMLHHTLLVNVEDL